MADVPDMGTQQDMTQRQLLVRVDDNNRQNKIRDARKLIYERNYAVDSAPVQALLKDESLIPTTVSVNRAQGIYANLCGLMQNAFSERLSGFGFCIFTILVVDLLHEFELGVWKAVLSHLLRMVESLKGAKLRELDQRKAIPTNKLLPTTQLTPFLIQDIARSLRSEETQSGDFRRMPQI